MSDFHSAEATFPGELTVIRAMRVDYAGNLHSPMRDYVWEAGENHADCGMIDRFRISTYYYGYSDGLGRHSPERVASRRCTCGFYAYFKPSNAHVYLPDVPGEAVYVICGAYGLLTYGDDGLRASKMRIKAIVPVHNAAGEIEALEIPPSPVKPKDPWKTRTALLAAMLITSLTAGMNDYLGSLLWYRLLWYVFAIPFFFLLARDFRNAWRYRKAVKQWSSDVGVWSMNTRNILHGVCAVDPKKVKRMKDKYPNIPFYNGLEVALKEHPLSKPPKV